MMDDKEIGRMALVDALCRVEYAATLEEAREIASTQLRLAGVANIKKPDDLALTKARELKLAVAHYKGSDRAPASMLEMLSTLGHED